jgi:uncharacterized membrane protein
MKVALALLTLVGFMLFESPLPSVVSNGWKTIEKEPEKVKSKVYEILQVKCNSCHRKQNPFMIFSEKNMDKRAEKIYQQVIVQKRMPKEGKLTNEEYNLIKEWLLTEINK